MSKHNRRRTRGGHKTSTLRDTNTFELPSTDALEPPDPPDSPRSITNHFRPHSIYSLSARHWNNRYFAWQARERRQKEEQEQEKQLIREQRLRIFGGWGGEDGGEGSEQGEDDEELCVRMMDYFQGLDWLLEG